MDNNKEILNAIENINFSGIEKELNNILNKYGLSIPYDFERHLCTIKTKFIQDEIKKANIHIIEKHDFNENDLNKIDSLQEIKDLINKHFSSLNNDDKIKECIDNLHLKGLQIGQKDFEKYGLNDTENNYYWGRVYKFNKNNNIISFSLGSFEQCSYKTTQYSNFNNYQYLRSLNFIIKEFLGIEWNINEDIKTYLNEEDFNKWITIWNNESETMEFKIYKNGRLDIKHKKAIDIFREFKKYATPSYIYIEK